MTKTATIRIYEDPGHGWAKVPKARLVELGIADKITPYSYENKGSAFLEEDCDLSTYIKALEARGITVRFNITHANKLSKIRGYSRYQVDQ